MLFWMIMYFWLNLTSMQSFQMDVGLPVERDKSCFRVGKCSSNRTTLTHAQPYSQDYLRAKHKAFERYKQIYPVKDKENLYQLSKTPCLGYYVMKGYRPQQSLKQKDSNCAHTQSSDKIISNMLKKYLNRKQLVQSRQLQTLPKIEQPVIQKHSQTTSLHIKRTRPPHTRIYTECDQSRLKSSINCTTAL